MNPFAEFSKYNIPREQGNIHFAPFAHFTTNPPTSVYNPRLSSNAGMTGSLRWWMSCDKAFTEENIFFPHISALFASLRFLVLSLNGSGCWSVTYVRNRRVVQGKLV